MTRTYRDDLLFALRMRDVPGPRIAEALAEVDSHVGETGEDPREAFGPPDAYADQLCEALGTPARTRWSSADSLLALGVGLGVFAGTTLTIDGAFAVGDGRGPLGLPAWVALTVGVALLAAVVAGLLLGGRRWKDPVTDPRDGSDMTRAIPRWVGPMMVLPPVLSLVIAVVLRATS